MKPVFIDRGLSPFSRLRAFAFGLTIVSLFAVYLEGRAQQPLSTGSSPEEQGRVKVVEEIGPWKMVLLRDAGTLLAEGKNTLPIGALRLKTYRIEEVAVNHSIKIEIDGRPATTDKAWRLTVTGGPFRVRDAAPILWIDGKPLGFGLETPDLRGISFVIYDRALMRNGASIALSYGENDTNRIELPERIALP